MEEKPKPKKPGKPKIYWKNCSVCQFMKKNKEFRYRCMKSTYFDPDGHETLSEINASFGSPFKVTAIYQHMKRHQFKDLILAPKGGLIDTVESTLEMLDAPIESKANHEIGLDDFIQEARNKLARGELQISATTFLQAIKIKMENEKGNKDRKFEALKTLFAGAAPKKDTDGN